MESRKPVKTHARKKERHIFIQSAGKRVRFNCAGTTGTRLDVVFMAQCRGSRYRRNTSSRENDGQSGRARRIGYKLVTGAFRFLGNKRSPVRSGILTGLNEDPASLRDRDARVSRNRRSYEEDLHNAIVPRLR